MKLDYRKGDKVIFSEKGYIKLIYELSDLFGYLPRNKSNREQFVCEVIYHSVFTGVVETLAFCKTANKKISVEGKSCNFEPFILKKNDKGRINNGLYRGFPIIIKKKIGEKYKVNIFSSLEKRDKQCKNMLLCRGEIAFDNRKELTSLELMWENIKRGITENIKAIKELICEAWEASWEWISEKFWKTEEAIQDKIVYIKTTVRGIKYRRM